MEKRDKLLIESLKDIDITPTMEKNAREKYKAISEYLNGQNLESDFYPQGSFLLGTVIRPYRDGKDKNYDLDILALLKNEKSNTDPQSTKNDVGDCIKSSELYKSKLSKEDKNCWTLEYAEVSGGVGFNLDIVPCVNEEENIKTEIVNSGVDLNYVFKTVSITEKEDSNYSWLTSNPLGFGDWFKDISERFISTEMKMEQFHNFPVELREIYNKVENIPNYYYRSNLQRAVQVVKRHRDIFYDRSRNIKSKPSSILITALIADSVKDELNLSIIDIIKVFIHKFKNNQISIMVDNKILNPVDLREDFISKISESEKNIMNSWLADLSNFINIDSEIEFKKSIHNDFNSKMYSDAFYNVNIVNPTKPWRYSE